MQTADDRVDDIVSHINPEDVEVTTQALSISGALEALDAAWFSRLNPWRRDLIGDYAGSDLFVIDGDSLCQVVLDDPLLALGRIGENSFQILHAVWILEKLLHDFSSRKGNFEVVFFESNQHLTLPANDRAQFCISSRILARSILKRHLSQLFSVHDFSGVFDGAWSSYVRHKRPMFVMCNTGGFFRASRNYRAPPQNVPQRSVDFRLASALAQRTFIHRLLSSGISVAILESVEFFESKVVSFIYTQRRGIPYDLPRRFLRAHALATRLIDITNRQSVEQQITPEHLTSFTQWYKASALHFIRSFPAGTVDFIDGTLLHLFVIQAFLLPKLTITDRAQSLCPINPKLYSHLQHEFLPRILSSLNATLPSVLEKSEWRADVDGRMFLRLLSYFTDDSAFDLARGLGPEISRSVSDLWESIKQESGCPEIPSNLVRLREQYPSSNPVTPTLQTPTPATPTCTFRVLPFENAFFNIHLSKVRVEIEEPLKEHTVVPIKKLVQAAKDDWDDNSDEGFEDSDGDNDEEAEASVEAKGAKTAISVRLPPPDPSILEFPKNFATSSRGLYQDDRQMSDAQKILLYKNGKLGQPPSPLRSTLPGIPSPSAAWLKKREERGQQILARMIHQQAETMTGIKGAKFKQQAITLTGISVSSLKMTDPYTPANRKVTRPPKSAPLVQRNASTLASKTDLSQSIGSVSQISPLKEPIGKKKGGKVGGKKAQALNSKDRLLTKIVESKQKVATSDSERWWASMLKELDSARSYEQKHELLQSLSRNKRMNPSLIEGETWLPVEVAMFRLNIGLEQWFNDTARDTNDIRTSYTVKILKLVKEFYELPGLYPSAVNLVQNLLKVLGHGQLCEGYKPDASAEDRKISFPFIRFASSSNNDNEAEPILPRYGFLSAIEGTLDFQLNHFGQYMDRSMDSKSDPRVSFKADGWQREVLDRLDARESVLVIAPTSAGKTFISFYAMEQVLSESDDGILVYVSSSKALINQIAGEVSARFTKDLKSGSFWAADNGDFKIHDALPAQIMVMAPQVLSEMLLNPVLARTWASRIRWIIFDEIHCIGQQEGGAVWEQLILLAPCPIIGLSATIGNPEEFNAWLGAVQKHHGFPHNLIQHQHRYSHLRKFFYPLNAAPPRFEGLGIPLQAPALQFIHPISVLQTRLKSLPSDLALESRDCMSLFKAMKTASGQTATNPWTEQLEKLEPRIFFASKSGGFLQQMDIIEYEVALKRILSAWMDDSGPGQALVQKVANELAVKYSAKDLISPTEKLVMENIGNLLAELHERNELPALLFCFDRKVCEKIGQAITTTVQNAQARWQENSPDWKAKLASWEKWQARAKIREREAERRKNVKPSEGISREETERRVADQDRPWQDSFDPDDPSPQFSFANEKASYSRQELKKEIEALRWSELPDWFLYGLKIGVGIHHSGLPRKYRILVESLFRNGFLRVVVSTETLALGINAPCKTVVFVTDSLSLTALNYRQCAGRAGRRGFDLLGNVIFYGIPVDRVHGIIMSTIPPLTGSSPLTATLSLRLCNLLRGSSNAPYATNAIRSLLEMPQLSVSSRTGTDENLYYLRFLLDYLRRDTILDIHGQPKVLFPIMASLHNFEPSNLALSLLLRSGVIHRICSTIDSKPSETKRNLIHLLAHLFERKVLPPVYLKERTLESIRRTSASKVVLSPLPDDARKLLQLQDVETLKRLKAYVAAYAIEYDEKLGPDDALPFSGKKIGVSPSALSPFVTHLHQTANTVIALSRFVANSGETDATIKTINTLTKSVRSGIHLNKHAIPSMESIGAMEGDLPLNAYILDFFIHGQLEALIHANRVKRGELWYNLQGFYLAMGKFQVGLERLIRSSAEPGSQSNMEYDGGVGEEDNNSDGEEDRRDVDHMDGSGDGPHMSGNIESQGSDAFPRKPDTITQDDWNVYMTVVMARIEFADKFKKIWA